MVASLSLELTQSLCLNRREILRWGADMTWKSPKFALLLLLAPMTASAADAPIKGFPPTLVATDLVLRDASIATLDPLQPYAQAVAVQDGKIVALGSNEAIAHYIGPRTKVIDLHGAFVTPGFMEGHGHILYTGESLTQLNAGMASNWDAIVAMVKTAAAKAKPGEWIVGQGWQQSKWDKVPQPNIDGLPLPASLDAVSPNNPVLLAHAMVTRSSPTPWR